MEMEMVMEYSSSEESEKSKESKESIRKMKIKVLKERLHVMISCITNTLLELVECIDDD